MKKFKFNKNILVYVLIVITSITIVMMPYKTLASEFEFGNEVGYVEYENSEEMGTEEDFETLSELLFLTNKYGQYMTIDFTMYRTPFYRASVENPNTTYILKYKLTELNYAREAGFNVCERMYKDFFLEDPSKATYYQNGDFDILEFTINTNNLYALEIISEQIGFVSMLQEEGVLYFMLFNNEPNFPAEVCEIIKTIVINFDYYTQDGLYASQDFEYEEQIDGYNHFHYVIKNDPDDDAVYTMFYLQEIITPAMVKDYQTIYYIAMIIYVIVFAVYFFKTKND